MTPPPRKKTYRKEEVAELGTRLLGLPRFKDRLTPLEAVKQLAPTVQLLLDQGHSLDEIAKGIAELEMLTAGTFKRYWSVVQSELRNLPRPERSVKKGAGRTAASIPPTDAAPDGTVSAPEPAPPSSTERPHIVGDRLKRTGEPAGDRKAQQGGARAGMLVPRDGKFD